MLKQGDGIMAWWFYPAGGRFRPPPPCRQEVSVRPGLILTDREPIVDGPLSLKGCERPLDALRYAAGSRVARVRLCGEVVGGSDLLCASRLEVFWVANARATLHEFACRCAEEALGRVGSSDRRSVAAIEAKRRWILGGIDDAGMVDSRAAAWSATIGTDGARFFAAEAAARAAGGPHLDVAGEVAEPAAASAACALALIEDGEDTPRDDWDRVIAIWSGQDEALRAMLMDLGPR